MPATPPVDFQKLAQSPRGATNADYPFAIRATDLNRNFVFATLDIEDGLYSETTGMQGHRQRRLRLKPGTAAGQLMQWTGDVWEALPTPASAHTLLVWNGTAWVASGAPTAAGQLLQWNGTAWAPLPTPTTAHTLLVWNGTSWIASGAPTAAGQLLQWTGTAWTPLPTPSANTMLLWNGTAWTSTPAPPSTGTHVLGAVGGVISWIATEECA